MPTETFELIAKATGTPTFTNIPSTYTHLYLIGSVRDNDGFNILQMRFNNASSTSYDLNSIYADGSSPLDTARLGNSFYVSQLSTTTNDEIAVKCWIPNYTDTSRRRKVLIQQGAADRATSSISVGEYISTSVLTQINLFSIAFADSEWALYGLDG